jgi:hypothetical protein
MKRIKLIISAVVLLLNFSIYSQTEMPKAMLGFTCGGAGSSTKSVSKVYNYISEKKYGKVLKLLSSKNTAEKFLAIVMCEKLAEMKKLELTQKDSEIIKKAYDSDELIYYCGGCTFTGNLKMSVLLKAKEDMEHVRQEAEEYFKDIL